MLKFFRKYQKIFFIIVTVFVVISFSFFGTFSTFSKDTDPDRVLEKTVRGTAITLREMEAMNRLLAASFEERSVAPNLFNDGVIVKEFFNTGMGSMLAEQYFEEIKADLEPRLKKAKYYKPYVHPKAPFISAELTWQQYFPGMSRDLALLKAHGEGASLEEFHLLTRLYMSQIQLPADTLKQLLFYQQGHYQNLPPDPQLQRADLSLFGFHTFEDWFGSRFLSQVSRFILNSAAAALEKGYDVSLEEARADLVRNVQTALSAHGIDAAETPGYFEQQLQALQLDEITAAKAWRKVMLFRRFFHDVGNSAVIDPLIYQDFERYANEGISVDLYELPEELKIKDINDFLKLQTYLEAVAPGGQQNGLLPADFLTAQEVAKKTPELIFRRFVVAFKEINKEKLAAQVSLKETWEWELKEQNWASLENAFFFNTTASTPEERFQYLETLEAKERLKVDAFARKNIVESRPEWLGEAFAAAEEKQETVFLRLKGGKAPFSGISDLKGFADLLTKAHQDQHSLASLAAQEKLRQFSDDQIHYYQFKVIECSEIQEILSFKEAYLDGTLQNLVDHRLEIAYPEVRRKESGIFQTNEGKWKPVEEVKEEIGKRLYNSLLAGLQNQPELRLAHFMKEAKKHLELDPEDPAWVQTKNNADSSCVGQQWLLQKSSKIISRASQDNLPKEKLLNLPVGSWSEIEASENKELFFVHVRERVESTTALKQAEEGQNILSVGARRFLMSKLLDEMATHGI